jgi:outer membrane protein OmpA-like peptidoglycan-associated protein
MSGSAGALAGYPSQLLPPTPMVLRDGRIARVTAFGIAMATGAEQPDVATGAALGRFADDIATDCFLTAQVIGHAESEMADADPLAPHRLARARADGVRAVLLQRGLPEGSVASVWDWQLGLREPRVTVWLFQLSRGEDCDGKPLDRPDGVPVGTADPPLMPPLAGPMTSQVAHTVGTAKAAAAKPRLESSLAQAAAEKPALQDHQPASVHPAPTPSANANAKPDQAIESFKLVAPEPPDAPAANAPARPEAPVPPTLGNTSDLFTKELGSPITQAARLLLPPPVVQRDDGLSITFDADSSYLPTGASRELRRVAAALDPGRAYDVELEGTVAPEEPAGAAAPNGHRSYARWVVERRLARIGELLRQNARARELNIHQTYLANDASRRVTLRLRPLS